MNFAENLKSIRKEQKLSQEELAEMLGVSRQAISKWEQDISLPLIIYLVPLSKLLNCSLEQLLIY